MLFCDWQVQLLCLETKQNKRVLNLIHSVRIQVNWKYKKEGPLAWFLPVNQKLLITSLFRAPSRSALSVDNNVIKYESEGMTAKE